MDEQELLRTVPDLLGADRGRHLEPWPGWPLRRRYPKDTVVFFENEEGDFFFMILEGRIKVTILGDDGREVILSVLGPATSSARWRCSTTSRARPPPSPWRTPSCCPCTATTSRACSPTTAASSPALIKVLTARLRRANHQISTLALLDVYGRVARVIVDMAREEGRRLKDGRIAFRRATHQEIANRIGTTRETVTRMLKDLERQGLIQIEGKEIVVQPDFEKVFD